MKKIPRYEPNRLEQAGQGHMASAAFREALAVYFELADGDPSLDAGYTAMRIGECYEGLSELHAARYWYGRAVEENPSVPEYRAARARLEDLDLAGLVKD